MHSYSNTARPNTSARTVTSPPSICSGAIWAGEPSTCPVEVIPWASNIFAMPKSVNLILGSMPGSSSRGNSTSTFSGLMSRWMTPFS